MGISIKERKDLRLNLLYELYDHYFENNGTALKRTREELQEDNEIRLAYDYLAEKSLIKVEKQGNSNFFIKLTIYGIDYVEDNHPDRFKSTKENVNQEPENTARAIIDW